MRTRGAHQRTLKQPVHMSVRDEGGQQSQGQQSQKNEQAKRSIIRQAADATKWTVVVLVAIAVLYKRDVIIASYVIGSLANTAVAKTLKKAFAQPRPSGSAKDGPGMPSSHATALSFLSVAAQLSCVLHYGYVGVSWPVVACALSIAVSLLASWWRVQTGYHSRAQVVVGWLLGSVNAVLWCTVVTPFFIAIVP